MNTRKEKLKTHLEKLKEIKLRLKLVQDEWVAYNKLFNEWIQEEIDVKEHKGELHLSEILSLWDSKNDSAS
jgi:hypothetical protein